MGKWRTIESAPTKTDILLWHPGSKYQKQGSVIGYMQQMGNGYVPIFGCTVFSPGDATHWMPLPDPPPASPLPPGVGEILARNC